MARRAAPQHQAQGLSSPGLPQAQAAGPGKEGSKSQAAPRKSTNRVYFSTEVARSRKPLEARLALPRSPPEHSAEHSHPRGAVHGAGARPAQGVMRAEEDKGVGASRARKGEGWSHPGSCRLGSVPMAGCGGWFQGAAAKASRTQAAAKVWTKVQKVKE